MIYWAFCRLAAGLRAQDRSLFRNPASATAPRWSSLRIRNGVEGYLWVQTVACAMIGIGSWVVMAASASTMRCSGPS